MFIPRGSQQLASQNSSSSSAGSFITVSQRPSQADSLSLRTLTSKSRTIKKKRLIDLIPKSFHHMFSSTKSSTSQPMVDQASSLPVQKMSQESREKAIAALPKYLRPVGENSFFPAEYSHLRHMVKNIYDEPEEGVKPGGSKQFNYFMSKPMTRTPGSSTDDSDHRQTLRAPPPGIGSFPQRMVSEMEKTTSSDAISVGLSAMLETMDPGVIVLSSDGESDDEDELSQCSMSSADARIAVSEREAAIFRKIEGEAFDKAKFCENLQNAFQ